MIVAALLGFLLVFVMLLLMTELGLGPDGAIIDPPDLSGMVDGAAPIFSHVAWLNKYLPIDQAVIILGVLVTAWLFLYGVRVTIWLLVKARILGGN